jgi:hypothetical protein
VPSEEQPINSCVPLYPVGTVDAMQARAHGTSITRLKDEAEIFGIYCSS